jgi:hypothetical protein
MSIDYSGHFEVITDSWRFTLHVVPYWWLSYWRVGKVRDLHVGPFIFRLQFKDFKRERKETSK